MCGMGGGDRNTEGGRGRKRRSVVGLEGIKAIGGESFLGSRLGEEGEGRKRGAFQGFPKPRGSERGVGREKGKGGNPPFSSGKVSA